MLCTFMIAGESNAQSGDRNCGIEPRLYLSALGYYWAKDDASARFDNLAATTELRITPCHRSWHAGLFVDYRYSADHLHHDKLNIGSLINFGRHRWDARLYAFVSTSPRSRHHWVYMGRVRYRLADDHKVGLEAIGNFRHAKAPQLLLAYYATVTDSLSLTLAAGRGTHAGPDLSARLELAWRVF